MEKRKAKAEAAQAAKKPVGRPRTVVAATDVVMTAGAVADAVEEKQIMGLQFCGSMS